MSCQKDFAPRICTRPESFIKSEACKLICFGVAVAVFLDWCAR